MKAYRPKKKFKKTRSIIALAMVVIVALALVVAGIGISLAERGEPMPEITGMKMLSEKLGATADFSKVFVRVTYNNGDYRDVPLSDLVPKNIDVTKEGRQNIVLSYGNKEYTVSVDVVLTEIKISYVTSGVGGKIVGELNQNVPAGQDGSEVEAVPDEGYTFSNWSIDGSADPVRREAAVSKDMEIRATFEKQQFIVTFIDAKGTSVERVVKYGESASPIPSEPGNLDSSLKRYGYEFVGWDTDEYKNVKRDMTVRAVMKKISANYIVDTSLLNNEPMARKVNTDTNILTDSLNGENLTEMQNGEYYRYTGIYQWNIQSAIQIRPEKDRTFVRWEIRGTDQFGTEQWLKLLAANPAEPSISGAIYLKTSADGDRSAVMFNSTRESDGTPSLRFVLPSGAEILEVRAIMAKSQSVITFKSLSETIRVINLPFGQSLTADQLAAPKEVVGYNFMGWYHEDGSLVNAQYAEYFYRDTVLTARLESKTIHITFAFPSTPGIPNVQTTAQYGTSLGNQSFPEPPVIAHHRFMRWVITACPTQNTLVGTTFSSETQVTDDITVSPEYEKITYRYTVSVYGQGTVTYQKNSESTLLAGSQIVFESGETYTLYFTPESGYSVSEYTISFDSQATDLTGTANLVTISNIAANGQINVTFVPQNHTVTIQNGQLDKFGTITVLTQSYNQFNISIDVLHGVPLRLEIKAPNGMRIASIKTDGNQKEFLPAGIYSSYSFAYASASGSANIEGDVVITITYTALEFSVSNLNSLQNGTAQLSKKTETGFMTTSETTFTHGTHLKVEITAANGYYIENLSIWGKSVDFYQYYYETYADDLLDNKDPYFMTDRVRRGFSVGDKRVTRITLYIPAANKTTEILIKFAQLSFNVQVEVDGFGEATLSQTTVNDNGTVRLTLLTDASYAFLSHKIIAHSADTPVEGSEIPSQSKENNLVITVDNILSDITIIVKFGRRSYNVLFHELTMGDATSYQVQSSNQIGTVDSNRNVSETVNHGANASFTLTAQSGYQLKEILLLDGFGQPIPSGNLPFGNPIQLPTNTVMYNLVLNGVTDDYVIKVTLVARNYEVTLDTNIITKEMAILKFSEADIYQDQYYPADARPSGGSTATNAAVFSYAYGKQLTLNIDKKQDFSIIRLVVNGQVYPVTSDSVTFTVSGNLVIEILLKYDPTTPGVTVKTDTSQGSVDYQIDSASKRIVYTPTAKNGYQLKTLYVNAVAVNLSNNGKYLAVFDENKDAHFVTAIFEKLQLLFDFSSNNGTLLAEKDYVLYGESTTVFVTPDTGYKLSSVKINGKELTADQVNAIISNGFFEIDGSETIGQNVEVIAKFSPLPYEMDIMFDTNGDGQGKIVVDDDEQNPMQSGSVDHRKDNVVYGQQRSLMFESAPGSYISEIKLNGSVVELSNMFEIEIKAANGKYAKGKLTIEITGNTTVSVRFDTDVFRVSIADAEGGTIALSSSGNKGNNEFGANEKVEVKLAAIDGYHIVGLTINNEAQNIELPSSINFNLNTLSSFLIPAQLLVKNLLVRAEFARNAYSVTVDIANVSPNFKATDNTVDRYANISLNYGGNSVTGNGTNNAQDATYKIIYPGIDHGGTPQLVVQPRLASGYEINSAVLRYYTEFGGVQTEKPLQFNATSAYTESLPTMYWDSMVIVTVRRKMVSATVVPPVVTGGNQSAVMLTPMFYSVGNKEAMPWKAPETQLSGAKTYYYEYGVRVELGIRLQVGYKITEFMFNGLNQTNIINDSLQNGVTKFTTALTEESNFTIAAEIKYISISVTGDGEGRGSFRINSEETNKQHVSVKYNTPINLAIFSAGDLSSYIEAIFVNGVKRDEPNVRDYVHVFNANEDVEIRIQFAMYYYDLKLGSTYPAMPEGLQSFSYNGASGNRFRWGTENIRVEMEVKEGYDFKGLTINGTPFIDYLLDGSLVTFTIESVKSDYIILPQVERKTFSVSAVHSTFGETKFYDANGVEITNDVNLKTVGYGDNIYVILKPNAGYYASSFTVIMEDLQGRPVSKEYPVSNSDKNNTDILRIDIKALSGKIEVTVSYQPKIYNILYEKPDAESGEMTVSRSGNDTATSMVEWGSAFKVTVKPNNGFDIKSFMINGYEYYLERLENFAGQLTVVKTYDPSKRTYTYEYSFIATEGLMNGHNGIIGSGTDRKLNLVVKLEKNMYYADSVMLQYVDPGTKQITEETVLTIPVGGMIQNEKIRIETFNSLRDGTHFSVNLNMQTGYSPVSVSVVEGHSSSGLTEKRIAENFIENSYFEGVTVTGSTAIANLSSPYHKTIYLVIKITKNTYDATFGVRTVEENGDSDELLQTIVASDKVAAKLTDENSSVDVTEDGQLSRIVHGITVQLTAKSLKNYSFKGYEMRLAGSAAWIPAKDEFDVDGINKIVIVEGSFLTVVMTKKFEFRAVYYRQVQVDVIFAPYHKYMSGNYTSGFGENMVFLTYAKFDALVDGQTYAYDSAISNGYRYTFNYNDVVLFTATDEQQNALNRSTKANYLRAGYKNGELIETPVKSVGTGSENSFQLRFVAKEEFIYDENLENNTAMYVAFDNNVTLNSTVTTNGGAIATDGGIITYQKKNANNQYEPLTFNNRTANVKVFDRIRITVTVNDGYRFDAFNRMIGSGVPNFKFNGVQAIAEYRSIDLTSWDVVKNNVDQRIKIAYDGSKRITIDLVAIENSIYEFLFTKVYNIDSFISAPKFVGDTDKIENGITIEVISGNKSFFDAATKQGNIDYGAWIKLELSPTYDFFKDSANSKYQFVGWYVNHKNATVGGNSITTYPGAWQADQQVQLTTATGYASSEKTAKTLQIYAEFMPMYQIQSHEYYKVATTTFKPTVSFNMYSYWYPYNDKDGTGAGLAVPSNRVAKPVDENASIAYYLPFDVQKGYNGLPATAEYANKITLSAIVNNSYTLIKWLIFYGNYNSDAPNYSDGIQIAGNNQDVEFIFTKEHYDKFCQIAGTNGTTGLPNGTISIIPVFNKQNSVKVTKMVFYNEYGQDTLDGRNENMPGYRVTGGGLEFFNLNEAKKLNFGEQLSLVANAHSSYRFIGWFDPSAPSNAPESQAISTAREYLITMDKESDTEYTFNLEARYIRQTELNIMSVNSSGAYVSDDAPKLSNGNKTQGDRYFYNNLDVVKNLDATRLYNLSELGTEGGSSANIRADVGSYVLFRLMKQNNVSGYDPAYDKFIGINSANAATAVTEFDDAFYVVSYMNNSRTIDIQFKTFGKVTLSGLLDGSTIFLGTELSKMLYDKYGNDVRTRCFNDSEVNSVVYERNRFTVVMNAGNVTGKINILGVEKKDYRKDKIDYNLFGLSSIPTGSLSEAFQFDFSGQTTANKVMTFNMQGVPFGSGGGTSGRPYMLNVLKHFDNMDVIYKLNGNSVSNVYFKLGADLEISGGTHRFTTGNGFDGNLNGGGKVVTVSGSFTTSSSGTNVGLFEKTSNATIENFVFRSSKTVSFAKETANAGLIVASANNTNFANLRFEGLNVNAQGITFGLVAGVSEGGTVKDVSIVNFTMVYGGGKTGEAAKGGLVGIAQNTELSGLTYHSNTSLVSKFDGDGINIGGFVGLLKGERAVLKNSQLYSGFIRGGGSVGGAVGRLEKGKIENVSVVLQNAQKFRMQIVAANRMGSGGSSYDGSVGNSDTERYAAGGIVGVNYAGTVANCFIKSENFTEEVVDATPANYIMRNIPTLSILGSLSGGLVGYNQNEGSTSAVLRDSYIEKDTMVELIMYDGKGVYGGLVGVNAALSKIFHCGINGTTSSSYQRDQNSGGNMHNDTLSADLIVDNNPFKGQSSSGMHYKTNVEFLFWQGAASLSSSGYMQGVLYSTGHNGTSTTGSTAVTRENGTTFMGGIAGSNRGDIINNYVTGKITHFRRQYPKASANIYYLLGGLVGNNSGNLFSSGLYDAVVYGVARVYSAEISNGNSANMYGATAGIAGTSGEGMRGALVRDSAVRNVMDPWKETSGSAIDSNWFFKNYAASLTCGPPAAQTNGILSFVANGSNKASATAEWGKSTANSRNFRQRGSNIAISPDTGGVNELSNNGIIRSNMSDMLSQNVSGMSGSNFFVNNGIRRLNMSGTADGNQGVWGLGTRSGNQVCTN